MTAGLDPSASRRPDGPSRRHFLRGLGASIALPAFASLGAPRLLAAAGAEAGAGTLAATASGAPLRAAFVYFPNGAIPASWWPSGQGTDFQFKRTLAAAGAAQGRDPDPGRPGPSDGRGRARTAAATMRAATGRS